MTEINVTHLVRTADSMIEFSSSIAESGPNVGPETWAAACKAAEESPLLVGSDFDEARDWLRGFGAWDDEELRAMSDTEIGALVLQFIASEIRECEEYLDDPEAFQKASDAGTISGSLYQGDDGEWYFYLGD